MTVVRPGAIYGPGETRFLKLFRAIARGRYAIVGTGRTFYHPVYIDDLVMGFLLALERPEAVGEAFLVCGPSYVSQRGLGALIAKHTGGRVLPFRIPARPIQWAGDLVEAVCVPLGLEPPLHRRRVDFWTKSRAFTIEKARRLLGYAPKVDLDEGILERRQALSAVPGLVVPTPDGVVRTPAPDESYDLDRVPLPSRVHVAPWQRRTACLAHRPVWLVETARGCPFRCSFCSVWQMYDRSSASAR